jgi:hypothetical protein
VLRVLLVLGIISEAPRGVSLLIVMGKELVPDAELLLT